jgi:hypothetical protein
MREFMYKNMGRILLCLYKIFKYKHEPVHTGSGFLMLTTEFFSKIKSIVFTCKSPSWTIRQNLSSFFGSFQKHQLVTQALYIRKTLNWPLSANCDTSPPPPPHFNLPSLKLITTIHMMETP